MDIILVRHRHNGVTGIPMGEKVEEKAVRKGEKEWVA